MAWCGGARHGWQGGVGQGGVRFGLDFSTRTTHDGARLVTARFGVVWWGVVRWVRILDPYNLRPGWDRQGPAGQGLACKVGFGLDFFQPVQLAAGLGLMGLGLAMSG